MKCPNDDAELIEFEKPPWLPFNYNEIPEHILNDVKEFLTVCHVIHRICPKCGYVEVDDLNISQFENFLKNLKKGDC